MNLKQNQKNKILIMELLGLKKVNWHIIMIEIHKKKKKAKKP